MCSKPPYENECVETSAEAKFRSKGTSRRRGTGGGGTFGADWELCMKWKFVLHDEQICACMGTLIIISGEICQFAFASLQRGRQYQTGAVVMWAAAGPNEVVSFPGHQNGSFTVQALHD